ncbi:hypothetical protein B0H16DRAFT_775420 [Mycena metata]|uniref:Uncharacterized protein n=1 Tax=Mycena metata TaxID=1033252 RepID=A0AAD7NAZ8_9AGAR|nr:hypothetical protein B0H16DRAFT_775420 [Mycena metata]
MVRSCTILSNSVQLCSDSPFDSGSVHGLSGRCPFSPTGSSSILSIQVTATLQLAVSCSTQKESRTEREMIRSCKTYLNHLIVYAALARSIGARSTVPDDVTFSHLQRWLFPRDILRFKRTSNGNSLVSTEGSNAKWFATAQIESTFSRVCRSEEHNFMIFYPICRRTEREVVRSCGTCVSTDAYMRSFARSIRARSIRVSIRFFLIPVWHRNCTILQFNQLYTRTDREMVCGCTTTAFCNRKYAASSCPFDSGSVHE